MLRLDLTRHALWDDCDLIEYFLVNQAANNLWGIYPPFQIDGNFGMMAGVAEMLLQSHRDVIKPLPALPKEWAEAGRFEGLVARGNFVVSAHWRRGELTELSIHSRSGRPCTVTYPGLTTARLADGRGRPVVFERVAEDTIRFATEVDGRYSIRF